MTFSFNSDFDDDEGKKLTAWWEKLAEPRGFEPLTPCFVGKYSIQLNYGSAFIEKVALSHGLTHSLSPKIQTDSPSLMNCTSKVGQLVQGLRHRGRKNLRLMVKYLILLIFN